MSTRRGCIESRQAIGAADAVARAAENDPARAAELRQAICCLDPLVPVSLATSLFQVTLGSVLVAAVGVMDGHA